MYTGRAVFTTEVHVYYIIMVASDRHPQVLACPQCPVKTQPHLYSPTVRQRDTALIQTNQNNFEYGQTHMGIVRSCSTSFVTEGDASGDSTRQGDKILKRFICEE